MMAVTMAGPASHDGCVGSSTRVHAAADRAFGASGMDRLCCPTHRLLGVVVGCRPSGGVELRPLSDPTCRSRVCPTDAEVRGVVECGRLQPWRTTLSWPAVNRWFVPVPAQRVGCLVPPPVPLRLR